MFKRVLGVALLGVGIASTAHASSVTLYGVVDIGIEGAKKSDQSSTLGMGSGIQAGSRWGIRGSEDLGGSLKANFMLETGITVNDGNVQNGGRLFGRAAWGGFSGSWGEIRLGRMVTAAALQFVFMDPFQTAFRQASVASTFNANSTLRGDNTVAYFTPKFGGFQAQGTYTFNADGGVATSDDSNKIISVVGKYTSGPLIVAASYETVKLGENTSWAATQRARNGGGDVEDPKSVQLAAAYAMNSITLHAGWSQMRNGYANLAFADGYNPEAGAVASTAVNRGQIGYFPNGKVNAYFLGLKANAGNGAVLASWQRNDPKGGVFDRLDANGQNIYSVGYVYPLSKRTSVHAFYSYLDKAWFDSGWSSSSYGVGMRHNF